MKRLVPGRKKKTEWINKLFPTVCQNTHAANSLMLKTPDSFDTPPPPPDLSICSKQTATAIFVLPVYLSRNTSHNKSNSDNVCLIPH